MAEKDEIEETLKKIKRFGIIGGIIFALGGLGVAIYYIGFNKK
jgi:hypothetical protein